MVKSINTKKYVTWFLLSILFLVLTFYAFLTISANNKPFHNYTFEELHKGDVLGLLVNEFDLVINLKPQNFSVNKIIEIPLSKIDKNNFVSINEINSEYIDLDDVLKGLNNLTDYSNRYPDLYSFNPVDLDKIQTPGSKKFKKAFLSIKKDKNNIETISAKIILITND